MLLLFALGFASGLPYLLVGSTLSAWLTWEHVPIERVGLLTLVALPYSFKFAWAPLLDRYRLPLLGRRRGWMLVIQCALIAAITLLGAADPTTAPGTTAAIALGVSFVSASLDVVSDAYKTDLVTPEERAAGGAVYVFGYRLAMLTSGALALRLFDVIHSWKLVYWIQSIGMVPGVVATLLAPEPPPTAPPRTLASALIDPLIDFLKRPFAAFILLFLTFYRAGDLVANAMLIPFLMGHGFTNTEIADATKVMGMAATIVGALAGGWAVARAGLRNSLLVFGALQAITLSGYWRLAMTNDKDIPTLWIAVAIHNLCVGLSIAALETFIMSLCNKRFTATQYALLSSAAGLGGRVIGGASGYLAEHIGFATFFVLTSLLSVPALLILISLGRERFDDH
jgi:PAT family beta-lactamase induction signal transducer AmpG